jgi:hypothetical protein
LFTALPLRPPNRQGRRRLPPHEGRQDPGTDQSAEGRQPAGAEKGSIGFIRNTFLACVNPLTVIASKLCC